MEIINSQAVERNKSGEQANIAAIEEVRILSHGKRTISAFPGSRIPISAAKWTIPLDSRQSIRG